MRKPITEYVGYGGREEYSELWPFEAPQQTEYHYSLYELKLNCEVDMDTGKLYLKAVEGTPLTEEIEI